LYTVICCIVRDVADSAIGSNPALSTLRKQARHT
jgi:hypothetical protein